MAGFEKIATREDDNVVELPTGPGADSDSKLAEQFLSLLMTTLSKRSVAIFSAMFTIIGLVSCWYLWTTILPNPTTLQLVGGGMYAVFLLGYEFVRRR